MQRRQNTSMLLMSKICILIKKNTFNERLKKQKINLLLIHNYKQTRIPSYKVSSHF